MSRNYMNRNEFKTYLGLTDGQIIPNNYERYIWISDRCTEGILWSRKREKKYEIISNLNLDNDNLKETVEYLKKVRKNISEEAAKLLNSYHGVLYNRCEWNYLTGY